MFQSERFSGKLVLPAAAIGFPVVFALVAYFTTKKAQEATDARSAMEHSKGPATSTNRQSGNDLHSPKHYDTFTTDILIRTRTGEWEVAAAALDTQCQKGDWISKRLVEELGWGDFIYQEQDTARVVTVAGEEVESYGSVYLAWKLALNENRVYRGKFFVLSSVQHLDVILGKDMINMENIPLQSSRRLFAPLAACKQLTQSDKAAIAAAKAQQEKDKKTLEARRQAAQQQQNSGQSADQQQQ